MQNSDEQLREDPDYVQRGAVRVDGVPREYTRFLERFSDDELAIVWKFSDLGFDPKTQMVSPYPGRYVMVKYVQPAPGSWRYILRRAVRSMKNRRDMLALLSLLRKVVTGYVPPVPTPAPAYRVPSPQRRCHRLTPARAP